MSFCCGEYDVVSWHHTSCLSVVVVEVTGGEFATSVCPKAAHLLPRVRFGLCLQSFDGLHYFILWSQQCNLDKSATVIEEQQEQLLAARSGGCIGATEIAMNDLKHPLGVVLCLIWEWRALMLADETPIAELIHMINPRQASNPILIQHLLDCLEVEMAQSRVPPPSLLLTPR
jgi:hypothetical protein